MTPDSSRGQKKVAQSPLGRTRELVIQSASGGLGVCCLPVGGYKRHFNVDVASRAHSNHTPQTML